MSSVRANPVGLDGIIEGNCPPYKSIEKCVDDVVDLKYGSDGVYRDRATRGRIFNNGLAEEYVDQVPHYTKDTIACVKDIVRYIYTKHRRFPAHVDAIYVPGIWLQAHHIDRGYYDKLFPRGYSESHRVHRELWDEPGGVDDE